VKEKYNRASALFLCPSRSAQMSRRPARRRRLSPSRSPRRCHGRPPRHRCLLAFFPTGGARSPVTTAPPASPLRLAARRSMATSVAKGLATLGGADSAGWLRARIHASKRGFAADPRGICSPRGEYYSVLRLLCSFPSSFLLNVVAKHSRIGIRLPTTTGLG